MDLSIPSARQRKLPRNAKTRVWRWPTRETENAVGELRELRSVGMTNRAGDASLRKM